EALNGWKVLGGSTRVDRQPGAPGRLCLVQRDVGAPNNFLGAQFSRGANADANAGIDCYLLAVHHRRAVQYTEDAPPNGLGAVQAIQVLEEDNEFVTAHARHRLAEADLVAQALSDFDQDQVAAGMAEAVVHSLEMVEVHVEHGDIFANTWR